MAKKEEDSEFTELTKALGPILPKIGALLENINKANAPIIRRWQYMNFIIMMSLVVAISVLAYSKVIDGSATTGLFGVIIGYVFGYLYSKKDK